MLKKILKHKADDEAENTKVTKRVCWGTDEIRLIPESDKIKLKKAIKLGDVTEVSEVLSLMDKREIRKILIKNENKVEFFWFKQFFYSVNAQAIANIDSYNSDSFKTALRYFIEIDLRKTCISFNIVGGSFQSKDHSNYIPQLREDFNKLRNEYKIIKDLKIESLSLNNQCNKKESLQEDSAIDIIVLQENSDDSTSLNDNSTSSSAKSASAKSLNNEEAENNHHKSEHLKETSVKEESQFLEYHNELAIFAWISNLPQYLQEEQLESAPVKMALAEVSKKAIISTNKLELSDFSYQDSPHDSFKDNESYVFENTLATNQIEQVNLFDHDLIIDQALYHDIVSIGEDFLAPNNIFNMFPIFN